MRIQDKRNVQNEALEDENVLKYERDIEDVVKGLPSL
jgi:hypothetical protein